MSKNTTLLSKKIVIIINIKKKQITHNNYLFIFKKINIFCKIKSFKIIRINSEEINNIHFNCIIFQL